MSNSKKEEFKSITKYTVKAGDTIFYVSSRSRINQCDPDYEILEAVIVDDASNFNPDDREYQTVVIQYKKDHTVICKYAYDCFHDLETAQKVRFKRLQDLFESFRVEHIETVMKMNFLLKQIEEMNQTFSDGP